MDYNGSGYFAFIKNLQGDIVSIVPLNSESNVEVNMEYDAWGKPIIRRASSAAEGFLIAVMMLVTNVGYRGYFYDFETGLYYLRSRYYDPETGRFINADDTAYLGYDGTPLSLNLFAYCENNPVNNSDYYGFWGKDNGLYGTEYSPKVPNFYSANDYRYDPNAKCTPSDVRAWKNYVKLSKASTSLLPRGSYFFNHYLNNSGRTLKYDYSKAIEEDKQIRKTIKGELRALSQCVESRGTATDYWLIRKSYFSVSCNNADWKFAINGHCALIVAQILYDKSKDRYITAVFIQSIDYYNFSKTNRFMGVYIRKPGRFEMLGWAKSFYSYGWAVYRLIWTRNNYDSTYIMKNHTPKMEI